MEKQCLLPRLIFPHKHIIAPATFRRGMACFHSDKRRCPFPERTEIDNSVFNRRNPSVVPHALPVDFLTVHNVQRVASVSSLVLMLSKGTVISKSLLLPLILLQAPSTVVSWIRSDYGLWTAFLGLLLRLFFYLPGELELPLMAMVLVITAPYQVLAARGTQGAAIMALVLATYLAVQHFSWAGNITEAFKYRTVLSSVALIFLILAALFFLI